MTTIITMIAAAFLSIYAHADYQEGRTRIAAKGDLGATNANGAFEGVDRAIVLQEYTDGVGISGYTILTGTREIHFKLGKVRMTRCGPVFTARSDSEKGIEFNLRDSAASPAAACRMPSEWTVELRKGKSSRLVLEGAPRRYLLIQR